MAIRAARPCSPSVPFAFTKIDIRRLHLIRGTAEDIHLNTQNLWVWAISTVTLALFASCGYGGACGRWKWCKADKPN
jgi:hypothetical protein